MRLCAIPVSEYNLEALLRAVEEHFALLEVWDSLRPGMKVLLKPNLLMKRLPERATTTHPLVVEAVALVLKKHGVTDITLADSPGGPYTVPLLDSVYKATGMAEVARRTGIILNRDTGFREVSLPGGMVCRSFEIIEPVCEADFIINLPKLKTHAQMLLSAGCKNLFGCVPGLRKPELHYRFPQKESFGGMLLDLCAAIKPGLTIADAVESMEGDGPSAGMVRKTGMTFASRDVHALDLGLCLFVGIDPRKVYTLRRAMASGLCPENPGELVWLGEKPAPVKGFRMPGSISLAFSDKAPKVLKGPIRRLERRFLGPRPKVRAKMCTGCLKCAESCAPGAIGLDGGKAAIDYSRCIRCYCCQEMCPAGAIVIHRFSLLRM
ncbi:MAG: DUF362 domain-containing protein [Oscillospiraceae bacterium]|nr:DUF362 domain-containing protein [Oscillospiraceae bacterium]